MNRFVFALAVILASSIFAADTPPAGLVPGLVGAYYAFPAELTDFPKIPADMRPFYVRVDKTVDFPEMGEGDFHGTKLSSNFYARWSGFLKIEKQGTYRFFIESDDGSKLFIDNKLVVNNGGVHSMTEKAAPVDLTPGVYPFAVEYFQGNGGAGCIVNWAAPGERRQPIPPARLFHTKAAEQIDWQKTAWELRRRPPVAGKYSRTNYGMYYTATVKASNGNTTNKGITIKVGTTERPANICFDPELMRYSVAWTGGWLRLPNGRDGLEGQPSVEGAESFSTRPQSPGWANKGEFKDPRPKPFGPLPSDWADYRGLYLNGDKVILSYVVGQTSVLELPGMETAGELDIFSRTLNLSNAKGSNTVRLFESAASITTTSRSFAMIEKDGKVTAAGLAGEPIDAIWEVVGGPNGFVNLKISAGVSKLKVLIWSGDKADLPKFLVHLATSSAPADLAPLTRGGAARWTEPVITKGALGNQPGAYVMDTLTVPYENPYNSYMRLTGVDFFTDGRAAVATIDGDVWIVSGINASLEKLTWKRHATGLFQALGLKIVDGAIYTLGRDQITRLHDLNNDGEADYYESFNNDCHVQTAYHEFAHDLQTDKDGNFYYMKGSDLGNTRTIHAGTMLKVSRDGKRLEVVAAGFRAPNGMCVGPNGELTTGDNQGDWTPLCPINWVTPGRFYGHVQKLHSYAQVDSPRDPPVCWLPMHVDNSAGGQVWATSDKWGPLQGRLLHMSYGKCTLHLVMMQEVNGVRQGGVVKFPFKFNSGAMRARFNPVDGQLYVSGMKGWQTDANNDGCFQRVRYTGKPANMPLDLAAVPGALKITFTDPLDPASAQDKDNWSAEWFNVVRTQGYGSPEYRPSDPKKTGHDPLDIASAKLSPDGKTITLGIPELKPVTNIILKFKIKGADGSNIDQEIDNTIHAIPGQ
jgi:PA14 domain